MADETECGAETCVQSAARSVRDLRLSTQQTSHAKTVRRSSIVPAAVRDIDTGA
jgi:hypothetical protein